jgi:hypothetical protein
LLVASVATRESTGAAPEGGADIKTTTIHLLTHQGMQYRETRSFFDGSLESMLFDLPSCDEPLQVIPTPRTFEAMPLFDQVGAPGDKRRFAYLSQMSEEGGRLWAFLEHVKHRSLELIAMTHYRPDGLMLMISEPRGCKSAPNIDWSLIWKTEYRLSIARNPNPPRQ